MKGRALLMVLVLAGVWSTGCATNPQPKPDRTAASTKGGTTTAAPAPRARPKPLAKPFKPRVEPMPAGVKTFKVRRGIPITVYFRDGRILSAEPRKTKTWKPVFVPRRHYTTWFAKLTPGELGTFLHIQLIMAVWHGPAGYRRPGRFSLRILIRHGDKEEEVFRTMIVARGQRYQVYNMYREIAQTPKIKPGGVLVVRLYHRGGSTGAVGVGGGVGFNGAQITISPNKMSPYYLKKRRGL